MSEQKKEPLSGYDVGSTPSDLLVPLVAETILKNVNGLHSMEVFVWPDETRVGEVFDTPFVAIRMDVPHGVDDDERCAFELALENVYTGDWADVVRACVAPLVPGGVGVGRVEVTVVPDDGGIESLTVRAGLDLDTALRLKDELKKRKEQKDDTQRIA